MKNSILFEKSDKLAHLVYKLTKNFPKEELYGLTSQLRRAVLSVPLNIVEGFARQKDKSYRQFLLIAYGSLKETKYLLHFSLEGKLISDKEYKSTISLAEEVGKMLWSMIKTFKNKVDSETVIC